MDLERYSIDRRFVGYLIANNLRRKFAVGHTKKHFIEALVDNYRDLAEGEIKAKSVIGIYQTLINLKISEIQELSQKIKESDSLEEQREFLRQIFILEDELEDLLEDGG